MAIFAVMLRGSSVGVLLRALLLALTGFVLSPDVASAHGSAGDHGSPPQMQQSTVHHGYTLAAADTPMLAVAERQEHGSGPCAGDSADNHFADSCCNMACHAALAAAAVQDPGSCEFGRSRLAGLSDVLAGLPTGGTERPPRRG